MNVGDDVTTSAQYSVTSGHVTTTAQYPVTSAVAMTTQNADQPQYPASMLTEGTRVAMQLWGKGARAHPPRTNLKIV